METKESEPLERKIENSSQIEKVKYNEENKTLSIAFKSKSGELWYEYYVVPKDVFDGIFTAESAGKYINTNVKGKYEFKRIE
jgi:hypothetical protein